MKKKMLLVFLLYVSILNIISSSPSPSPEPYDLPLLNLAFYENVKDINYDDIQVKAQTDPGLKLCNDKLIPKTIWVAVKNSSDPLPNNLVELFKRNKEWEPMICGNECKNNFMNTVYGGTSIQWAYSLIHHDLFFSKADIWRYSALYYYGGYYTDDDSDIGTPLDEITSTKDTFVLSEEGANGYGECYTSDFHLSNEYSVKKFAHNYTNALHYEKYNKDEDFLSFFHGHTLLNWNMFVAPRHPLLLHTLSNIVEIVKNEFLRNSYIHMTRWDVSWKHAFCCTVFSLTYSLRELLLMQDKKILEERPYNIFTSRSTNIAYRIHHAPWIAKAEDKDQWRYLPRIEMNNFQKYGGRVKAYSTQGDQTHYRQVLKKKSVPLISSHADWNLERAIKRLEGHTVMGESGKEVYLISNGTKHAFGDGETFEKMGFSFAKTRHIRDKVLHAIPQGDYVKKVT